MRMMVAGGNKFTYCTASQVVAIRYRQLSCGTGKRRINRVITISSSFRLALFVPSLTSASPPPSYRVCVVLLLSLPTSTFHFLLEVRAQRRGRTLFCGMSYLPRGHEPLGCHLACRWLPRSPAPRGCAPHSSSFPSTPSISHCVPYPLPLASCPPHRLVSVMFRLFTSGPCPVNSPCACPAGPLPTVPIALHHSHPHKVRVSFLILFFFRLFFVSVLSHPYCSPPSLSPRLIFAPISLPSKAPPAWYSPSMLPSCIVSL